VSRFPAETIPFWGNSPCCVAVMQPAQHSPHHVVLFAASSVLSLAVFASGCADADSAPGAAPAALYDDDGAFLVDFPADDAAATSDPGADETEVPWMDGIDSTADDAAAIDSATSPPPLDPAPDGACSAPLAQGDLVIDELMIASVAGTGDDGEWLEVRNTLGCDAPVQGLHGECPRGATVFTFDVSDPLWIPPQGTFVVADSSDPAINHGLPGTVVVWSGRHGDVLRNKGTTVTLSMNGTMIDAITYPSLPLTIGESISFPSDCAPAARTDWTRWQTSTASWFPAFSGTPNGSNDDVHCP
jgi:hypothetical protein